MNLHEIGLKYSTDKASYHKYLDFYERHIDKNSVKRFLEIGVWEGFSIRMWRDWFNSETIVEGWDINPSPQIENTDLRIVDQTNKEMMLKNVTGVYDLILDDGGHTAEMIQGSFSTLFPYSKMYILEDLHAPLVGDQFLSPGDISTIDILNDFSKNGWNSKYATEEEKKYIETNAEIVDIYYQHDGNNNVLSISAIVKNKYYA
jgi:hypothetical protein